MGVAREIGEHRCGSGEWPLGVDDPFGPSQRSERGGEGAPVSKGYEIAEEGQPPGLMQRREAFEKQPPEQARQRPDGQEEAGLAGDPARTVRRQAAAGHNHVHVRVVSQSRAPGVQHGGEANASPQVFWVGRNGDRRLGGGPEQQVVDDGLVLERDWRDRGRQGEDEVIVGDRQQIVSLGFQPLSRRRALALRAMTVPARVVGDLNMGAVVAALDVTAKRRSAARSRSPT